MPAVTACREGSVMLDETSLNLGVMAFPDWVNRTGGCGMPVRLREGTAQLGDLLWCFNMVSVLHRGCGLHPHLVQDIVCRFSKGLGTCICSRQDSSLRIEHLVTLCLRPFLRIDR